MFSCFRSMATNWGTPPWTIPNVSKCCMFALQLPLPWSFLMSKYVEMSCIRTLTRHQLQITDFDNFDSLGCAICPWAFMEDICSKWRQNIADDANGCASCKPCLCWYLARENTPFIIYRGFTRWSIPYILGTHGKSRCLIGWILDDFLIFST